jgi:adenosine deaminase
MSFLRHLSEADGFATLDEAMPYLERIDGVGLDSSEQGNPPEKFARLFERCKELGLPRVAHAGEEGPPEYVRQALELLDVARIDHGVRSLEDEELVQRLVDLAMPLTVCPFSNVRLKVVETLAEHNLKQLLERGLMVTVNSDDPAYFGGYLQDNLLACAEVLDLSREQVLTLVKNGFIASWLSDADKAHWLAEVDRLAA